MTFHNTTQKSFLDASSIGRTSSDPFVDEFQPRDPTPSDVNYPVQKRWLNTATEAYWLLIGFSSIGGFVSAIWIPFGAGGGSTLRKVGVDTFSAPGTNPVVPDVSGLITVSGNQIPAGSTANVIRTNSILPNHYNVEIQRSQAVASSTVGDNGVSHFDSSIFSVDSNGFVSLSSSFSNKGTFLPTLTFGGSSVGVTYGFQFGEYVVLSNVVFFSAFLTLTSKGTSTGQAAIGNLPFPVGSATHGATCPMGTTFVTFSPGYTSLYAEAIAATNTAVLLMSGSGLSATQLFDTNFADDSHVDIGGFYFTA